MKDKPYNLDGKMKLTDEEIKKKLTKDQYKVLRESQTEPPFSGVFDDFWQIGQYRCALCHQILFESNAKYEAGCGWPSFWQAIDQTKIKLVEDRSHFMIRTEVRCANCDSHLGHLFNDGPVNKGGQRFCINSLALDFKSHESTK